MKAAQLRQAILQAAVQGKLVPQNPQDEPASELLKRIQAEKARLVKEGKIKKEKPLPPVSDEERPYELPEGWEWCRLGDLCSKLTDGTHVTPKYTATGVPFLSVKDVSSGKIDFSNTKFISSEDHSELYKRCDPQKGDILLTKVGTTGIPVIIDTDIEFSLFVSIALLKVSKQNLNIFYIKHLLNSPLVYFKSQEKTRGVGNKNWVLKDIANTIISIPPLSQQQRIVTKIDTLIAFCDELEAAEKEFDALDVNLAEYLPKSILQAAVQGKLVPQNPHDEPASELLKRIQAEKTRLVKAGEIKKEKPLPPVSEEEIPYDLPEGWKWCRLGSVILQNIGGGTPSKTVLEYWDGDIYWASVKDLSGKYLNTTRDMITNKGLMHSTSNLIPPGNIIVCTRMGLGKISINTIAVAINQDLRALLLSEHIDQDYFIYYYQGLSIAESGMTVKGITIEELNTLLFPLPPLAEQQRIVTKVDELIALCKQLQNIPPDSALLLANIQKLLPSQSAPTSSAEPEEQYAMAARGAISATETKKHRQAVADLFGDDVDG